jgi:hypothetical protein
MMQAPSQAGNTASTQNPPEPVWLARWKDYADASASTLTAVGLVIAGVWTYMLFVRKRQRFPRANVEHRLADWPVEGQRLLRVVVCVKNVGEVIVRIRAITAAVMQLLPSPPDVASAVSEGRDPVEQGTSEVLWDTLGQRRCDFTENGCEVEPDETDEFIFDFIIPQHVTKVQIYTHVENIVKSKKNIGWNSTTVYDMGGTSSEQERQDIVSDRTGKAEADQGAPTAPEENVGVPYGKGRDTSGNAEGRESS